MDMFCFQCQEAAKNEGCDFKGVCGKNPEIARLQDLLVWQLKGIAFWAVKARSMGLTDPATEAFTLRALFTTITNVNFDADRLVALLMEGFALRDALKTKAQTRCRETNGGQPCTHDLPEFAVWVPKTADVRELAAKGHLVGVMADLEMNADIRSLRELLIYGVKGLAAYTEHALVLDRRNAALVPFMQEALLATTDESLGADALVGLVLKCGEMAVQAMALLDEANTSRYGHPEPTQVNLGVKEGPAILVSGHDLRDLEELLQQTEGTGVNVYTHGEMLPANAYPAFKKYAHFVGNYGDAWYRQQDDFEKFGGAILMTTNCLIPPNGYQDRLFTTGVVGWPGCAHIADRVNGGQKDFSAVIAKAKESGSPQALEQGTIPVGFAHATVMSVADKVIEAVKSGAIKRFVVMAGCDGRHKSRQYYTDIAAGLPQDHVILTAGCAKYRYNKLNLGTIGGIPRILDAGQCNDSYSLVYIAQQLAKAFDVADINDLPISYDIAWYEQKAVTVLLALLYLGVKKIRLGPTLPAFLSPNVIDVLVKNFDLMPIGAVEDDLVAISAGR